jgi:hypothetical protein
MSAKSNLERGLTKEVKQMPEPFTGLKIGHRGSLDVGRPSLAAEVVLGKTASQLHCCRAQKAAKETPPPLKKQIGPPSNSPHLPRAGGGRRRRTAQRRTLAEEATAHARAAGPVAQVLSTLALHRVDRRRRTYEASSSLPPRPARRKTEVPPSRIRRNKHSKLLKGGTISRTNTTRLSVGGPPG